MESLSSAELMEVITLLESSIDVQFQIWITATFAFIAANFVARGQLPKLVLFVTIALYSAIVIALWLRWITDGARGVILIQELNSRGIDFSSSSAAAIFRLATYTVGSATTVFLAIYFDRKGKNLN